MPTVFIFTAHDGKLDIGTDGNRARLNDYLKTHEGKKMKLQVIDSKRSLSINARYWAYLNDCEEETGNLATDLHEIAKRKFLKPKFIKVKVEGKMEEMKVPRSTTELTGGEFSEYLMKLEAWTGIPQRTREELGYLAN